VQELLGVEDEKESGDEEGEDDQEDSSEYEEYSGSEEEDTGPRLKPVFVRKYEAFHSNFYRSMTRRVWVVEKPPHFPADCHSRRQNQGAGLLLFFVNLV